MAGKPPSHPADRPNATGPVTLRMVAEAAGVSVSTASRSLNGQARRYRISESTEKNVREIASRLGFRPSLVARSLRLKQSGLIGMIVPDLSNPFFSAIAREISLGVEPQGFSVLLGDSREETHIEQRLAEELRARQVEALLVCPVGTESGHLIELNRGGLPVIVADRVFPNTDLDCVTSDNVRAARELAEELLSAGHRRIGVLAGLLDSLPTRQRLKGLRQALADHDLELDETMIAGNAYTVDAGYRGTQQLLQKAVPPTALFAMCVPAAIGALRAVDETELSVPGDLSLVTFDEQPFADLMRTPLTASIQDVQAIGKAAAEVLIDRIRPRSSATEPTEDCDAAPSKPHQDRQGSVYSRLMIPTTLKDRGSIAAPPTAPTPPPDR